MIEMFFIHHQSIYRAIPTFILCAIRIKHLNTGHYGFIHKSKKFPGEWKCTACRREITAEKI